MKKVKIAVPKMPDIILYTPSEFDNPEYTTAIVREKNKKIKKTNKQTK